MSTADGTGENTKSSVDPEAGPSNGPVVTAEATDRQSVAAGQR